MLWTNQVLPLLVQRGSLNTSRSKDRTVSLFFLPKPLHSPHPLGSYIALPSSRSILKTKMAKVCARSRRSNGKIGDCEQSTISSQIYLKITKKFTKQPKTLICVSSIGFLCCLKPEQDIYGFQLYPRLKVEFPDRAQPGY